MEVKGQTSSRRRDWLVVVNVVGRCRKPDTAINVQVVCCIILEGASL